MEGGVGLSKDDGWICKGSFFGSKIEKRRRGSEQWITDSPSPDGGEGESVLEREQEADAELLWAIYALADDQRGNVSYSHLPAAPQEVKEGSSHSRVLAQAMVASEAQEILRNRRSFFPPYLWRLYERRRGFFRCAAVFRIAAVAGIVVLLLSSMLGGSPIIEGGQKWMFTVLLSIGSVGWGIRVAGRRVYTKVYRTWAKDHPVEVRMSIAALIRQHRTVVCGIETTRPKSEDSRVQGF